MLSDFNLSDLLTIYSLASTGVDALFACDSAIIYRSPKGKREPSSKESLSDVVR